jgi:hypothetical protein
MGSVTGTTTNTYVNALEWHCASFNKNTFIIENTDIANALKLKVLVMADVAGIEYQIELATGVTERILLSGEKQSITLTYPYASVNIAVKSNTTDLHATYQIDYIGGRYNL